MRRLILLSFTIVTLLALCACSATPSQPAPSPEKDGMLLAKLRIDAKTPNVLYTYLDDKGQYQTVDSADKVPDPFRNDVIVVNTALSPEARQSTNRVAVADLNRQNPDGSFVLRMEERAAFEQALKLKRQWGLTQLAKPKPANSAPNAAPAKPLPPNTDKIVLYSTSWCGYCKKVRAFLTEHNIPFVEKDVEKDDAAQNELMARCQAAGVNCQGVPILDIKGKIVPGYNPQALASLLPAKP